MVFFKRNIKVIDVCKFFHVISTKSVMSIYKSLPSVLEALQGCQLPEAKELLKIYDSSPKVSPSKTHRFPFIVFEGLDGTGKTTVVKEITAALNGIGMRTPPPVILHIRNTFTKQPTHIHWAYYALGNYLAAAEVEAVTLDTAPVVMDRFWYSTAAYALGHMFKMDPDKLPQSGDDVYSWPSDLIKPDIVLYLSVDETNRLKRMATRQEITEEEEELQESLQLRKVIETAYKQMAEPNLVSIDANPSIDDVVDSCLKVIKQQWPTHN